MPSTTVDVPSHTFGAAMCRFCCRNQDADGARRLVPFLKPLIVTRGIVRLRMLDFTDACNAYATHKGANGGGRATNLASLRTFCAIAANVNSN